MDSSLVLKNLRQFLSGSASQFTKLGDKRKEYMYGFMKFNTIRVFIYLTAIIAIAFFVYLFQPVTKSGAVEVIHYEVNPQKTNLHFYLKDEKDRYFKNFKTLKEWLKNKAFSLTFAMNGGMYKPDFSPVGLYIEAGKTISPLDTLKKGYGNFYLQPNGVFGLQKNHKAFICATKDFVNDGNISYATQSGPLLLIDGKINPVFEEASGSRHIRNAVGMMENGNLIFAISKEKINFYHFALFFKNKNCKNALYLDGYVSKMYHPGQKLLQEDGSLGVIIAEQIPLK